MLALQRFLLRSVERLRKINSQPIHEQFAQRDLFFLY